MRTGNVTSITPEIMAMTFDELARARGGPFARQRLLLLDPRDDLRSISQRMRELETGIGVVVRDDVAVGVVTEADLIKASDPRWCQARLGDNKWFDMLRAQDVMSAPVIQFPLGEGFAIAHALRQTLDDPAYLVIVDENGRPHATIGARWLLKFLYESKLPEFDRSVQFALRRLEHVSLVSVGSDETVAELVSRMVWGEVPCAPVIDAGKLVGIATRKDVARKVLAADKTPIGTTIGAIMTANPRVVTLDDTQCLPTLGDVARLMVEGGFRRIPVIRAGEVQTVIDIRCILQELGEMIPPVLNASPTPILRRREGA